MSIEPEGGRRTVTVASRLSGYLRGGGILVPMITAAFAFIVGGLVVLARGRATRSTRTGRSSRARA